MSKNSTIGWTHHTANPWWGCTKISPACDNCYAASIANRLSKNLTGERVTWGPGGHQEHRMDEVERDATAWQAAAAKKQEKHRVFCASMADVFEGRRDQRASLARLFPLIERTPNLNWLLLTKRPNLAKRLLPWERTPENVWVGTTVENQEWADKRVEHLLGINAAVRFVSVEPQLGAVDLSPYLGQGEGKINWVICGGESGVSARGYVEMLAWYRSLRDQCIEANVPFFFKQWGRFAQSGEQLLKLRKKNPENILDGLKWEQYPDEVRAPRPALETRQPSHWDRLLTFHQDLDGVEPVPKLRVMGQLAPPPDFMSY